MSDTSILWDGVLRREMDCKVMECCVSHWIVLNGDILQYFYQMQKGAGKVFMFDRALN